MDEIFTIDCDKVEEGIDLETVLLLNKAVTEPETVEEEYESWGKSARRLVEAISLSEDNELEISREEDYFATINENILGDLIHTQLRYECQNNNDVVFLASKIMEVIASSQIFGEGNKRTAYLSGCLFLIDYQLSVLGLEKAVIPVLDDELIELLSDTAVGRSDANDLEKFFSGLRNDLSQNIKDS
ncbi:MAG: prophage maintenance system killer protein [Candidatus Nanohaloarchaea archaeon]|jgi:prophage maintenance system killer protein